MSGTRPASYIGLLAEDQTGRELLYSPEPQGFQDSHANVNIKIQCTGEVKQVNAPGACNFSLTTKLDLAVQMEAIHE